MILNLHAIYPGLNKELYVYNELLHCHQLFSNWYKYLHHWQLEASIASSNIIIITIFDVTYFVANKLTFQITQLTVNVLPWKILQAKLVDAVFYLTVQHSFWGSQPPPRKNDFPLFWQPFPEKCKTTRPSINQQHLL